MPSPKMRPDEIDIDASLVGRLIARQFPQWAGLPLTRVCSAGTDNAMYRLGDDMAVRLPRVPGAVADVDKEQRWLPWLSPLLPLAVPVPLGRRVPDDGFPYPWSVYRWLDGANAVDEPIVELSDAAAQLGRFAAALRRGDATGGPRSFRGGPISARDDDIRGVIRDLGADGTVDADVVSAAWETARTAAAWNGARARLRTVPRARRRARLPGHQPGPGRHRPARGSRGPRRLPPQRLTPRADGPIGSRRPRGATGSATPRR